MSKLEVNAIEPQSGTTLTVGASGDTIVIPSGATISNQGTAAGFGPTGAVSWNTTKIIANPNPAVTGVGYFCDTTSAAFTVTLPSSPAAGAVVGIADYANTFATNNLTVGRNSSLIGGVATNATLSTNGLSVTFVYVDATQGWIVTDSGNRSDLPTPAYIVATGGTITTCGNFKIHSFTGPGTFTVCSVGNPGGSTTVDYLVVAGGGGGGGEGGGGGAGGYRFSNGTASGSYSAGPAPLGASALPVSVTGYPITVGGGGPGATSPTTIGSSGNPSIFSTITSTGGGFGGTKNAPAPQYIGGTGGSGGGVGRDRNVSAGTGNTPPVSPSQGNPGGSTGAAGCSAGGGGGGAGAAGSNGTNPGPSELGGPGGVGLASSITGSPVTRGGGGGGASIQSPSPLQGTGGTGGGGNAAFTNSTPGTINTGGGGGGFGTTSPSTAGSGGSGIVVIRYKFQ